MPRIDAIFIDFYGTLVTGDREAVERTCARVVDDHRLDRTAAQLAVEWGTNFFCTIERCNHDQFLTLFECECVSLRQTLAHLDGQLDPAIYARMLKDYWCDPPAAEGAIEALGELNRPVCIVSNADTEDVLMAMERRGIRADAVVTSEDARSYKPDRAIFEKALATMNVQPQRVLHVGDSLHSDIAGASQLGIHTCWVQYQDRILDVGTHPPDHQVNTLTDLPRLLA